jgi:hypothetical protein
MKKLTLLYVVLGLLSGCTLTKTENPLSPAVAGPIAGVNITAPNPLEPRDGLRIASTQQPIALVLNNATSSGARPISYRFEVAGDAGFATIVEVNDRVAAGEGGKTTFRMTQTLAAGKTYYWRAKAKDGANESAFSASASFEVMEPVTYQGPPLVAPPQGSTTTTVRPTFAWTNSARIGTPAGPVVYEIEVSETADFAGAGVAWINEAPAAQTSALAPQDGRPGAQYFWRVRARDAFTIGPWSLTGTFFIGGGATAGGGGGGPIGGGPVGTACHVAPGPLTLERADAVVFGCGNEFPHLLAVFGSESQAVAAAEQLLLRTIWHLKLAGYDAARQQNPSGLISNDKMSLVINGAWHVYDIFSLGSAGVPTRITGLQEVPLPNPVPHPGIPD